MFDLETAIAGWRKQIQAAGIKAPVLLEELEGHLREEIERQTGCGLKERAAFDLAVKQVGAAGRLKREFKKAGFPVRMRYAKLTGIACGFTSGAFLLWIVCNLLFIHETNAAERIMGSSAVALAILSWRYAGRILPVVSNPRLRTAIGFLSCLISVGGMMLFIAAVPHFLAVPAGAEIPIGRILVLFIWVWTAAVMLAAVAYRLEDAGSKNEQQYV
jgi:hypothetical protein